MREFILRLVHGREGEELDIREKLFRMLLLVGCLMCVAGIAEGIFIEYGITYDDEVSEVRDGGFGSTTKK